MVWLILRMTNIMQEYPINLMILTSPPKYTGQS